MRSFKRLTLKITAACLVIASVSAVASLSPAQQVSAAACVTPGTDYGTVSGITVNIDTTGTYKIWTRMAAANSSANTYLLEVDGNTCYTVGGSSVPTYSSGSSTRFASGTTNWINTTSTGSAISLSLSSGSHTLKLIGNAAGVVVDRLIVTASTTCTPTGTGGNCADTTAPTTSNIASSSVTHQAATITWTTNENSSSTVQYGTTTSYGSSATNSSQTSVTSHTVNLTGLTGGTTYHYRVLSADEAGNVTPSSDRTFTTAATPAYKPEDVNQDGSVGILDVSLVISKWSQTGAGLGRADINSDGVVNALDLSLLIGQYGQ